MPQFGVNCLPPKGLPNKLPQLKVSALWQTTCLHFVAEEVTYGFYVAMALPVAARLAVAQAPWNQGKGGMMGPRMAPGWVVERRPACMIPPGQRQAHVQLFGVARPR